MFRAVSVIADATTWLSGPHDAAAPRPHAISHVRQRGTYNEAATLI
jgi:hypothetical protein